MLKHEGLHPPGCHARLYTTEILLRNIKGKEKARKLSNKIQMTKLQFHSSFANLSPAMTTEVEIFESEYFDNDLSIANVVSSSLVSSLISHNFHGMF